jgi:hypothetical protein
MSLDAHRRQTAVTAAVAVADQFGMTPVEPVILRDSSHISIRLAPFEIVARVITPVDTTDAVDRLARELRVAQHLADAGAPVVAPSAEPSPGPYFHSGVALTLWKFVPPTPANETDAVIAAASLRASHEALISYAGELPPFTDAVDGCRSLLEDGSSLPALIPTDRTFLLAQYERLRRAVDGAVKTSVALHGDPHLGNVLMTSSGPLWTDFECPKPRLPHSRRVSGRGRHGDRPRAAHP